MKITEPVLVSIVTHDDSRFLERCLKAVLGQDAPLRVKVLDNASGDGSAAIARRMGVEVEESPVNLGFSAGHNRNIRGESFRYVIFLNPDCLLEPDYLSCLVETLGEVAGAGMAGGKLLRMDREGLPVRRRDRPVIDSTGMYFTPAQRHFDRGSGEEDDGRYDRPQEVFGITGAAMVCSREMLEDVRLGDEYFDEDFFAYREDADLCWRARLRGWKAIYHPGARAFHHRHVLPGERRKLNPALNAHSLKNRYLMRSKNMDFRVRMRCMPFMYLRDAAAFLYVLFVEPTSLRAYREVRALRVESLRKRRQVQSGRRIDGREMSWWFSFTPRVRALEPGDEPLFKRRAAPKP